MFSTNSSAYKLFNENNLDFMKRLPDSSIDLILTDPLIIPELSEPPVRTLGAAIPENESHIFR